MNKDWQESYLTLLGVQGREPTIETLTELAKAHELIVFANAPSLLRKAATPEGPIPPLDCDEVLSYWREQSSGGVCFEVATMLGELLSGLGFNSYNVLADIFTPRAHQANIVTVEGQRYLLDLGNGAPLFQPIPIDSEPLEIDFAGLGFRFDRQGQGGQLVQSRRIEGAWQPLAFYEDVAANDEEREIAFQLHHELPAKSFVMNTFRLVQVHDGEVLVLLNHSFTHYRPSGKETREVNGIDAYRGLIRDEFGLAAFPVDEALAAWIQVTGASI